MSQNRFVGLTLNTAVGSFLAVVGLLIGGRPIADNSFFTHLATGKLILASGSIPTTDPYSATAGGDPWVVQSWLASVIYAGLDAQLGTFGIRLFHGLLAAGIVWTVWKLTDRAGSVLVQVACTSAVIVVGASLWSPRPLLIGLLGFTLVLAALDNRIALWWLLPVMWVWVNSHGSFPLAGAVAACAALGAAIDHRTLRSHESSAFLWVCGGTALGAINPLGLRLLQFPVQLLDKREALENVFEWMPLTLTSPWGLVMVPLLIGLAAAVARGAGWTLILPSAVFVAAAFLAVRNVNVAAILLATGIAAWLPSDFGSLTGNERGRMPRLLMATSVGLLFVVGLSLTGEGVSLAEFPVADLKGLSEEGRVANPEQLLVTTDVVGNYLTVAYGSDASIFMDDRFDMYPLEVINDYETLFFGGDYRAVLDRYDAQTVLWPENSGLEFWLRESPDWVVQKGVEPSEVLDQNGQWIIARRVTPSPAVLASAP